MPPTEAELLAKMRVLEERIKAPSIWGRVSCGIRFEDLQEKRYEDTVRLVKKHFLPEELTYRSVKITEDKEGTDEFTHNLRIWMKDKMSIAAVKEGTEKLVGCLIMRIQEKRQNLKYPKPTCVHCMTRCMNVEEAKEICQDRSKWKEVVSTYPSGKQA